MELSADHRAKDNLTLTEQVKLHKINFARPFQLIYTWGVWQ